MTQFLNCSKIICNNFCFYEITFEINVLPFFPTQNVELFLAFDFMSIISNIQRNTTL